MTNTMNPIPYRGTARPSSNFSDFVAFRTMITPVIIQIVFWVGTVICVGAGLFGIVKGATARFGGTEMVLSGAAFLIAGPLVVRIYCEILILFFRMNETLSRIERNTEEKAPSMGV